MTPRFRLKEGTLVAFIPGAGRIKPESVVEGEKFRKYVPSVLVEIEQEPEVSRPDSREMTTGVADVPPVVAISTGVADACSEPSVVATEKIESIEITQTTPDTAVLDTAVGASIGTTEGALLVVDPNKPKRGRPRRS